MTKVLTLQLSRSWHQVRSGAVGQGLFALPCRVGVRVSFGELAPTRGGGSPCGWDPARSAGPRSCRDGDRGPRGRGPAMIGRGAGLTGLSLVGSLFLFLLGGVVGGA